MAQSKKRMWTQVENRIRDFCENMDEEVGNGLVNDLRNIIFPSQNPTAIQKMIEVLDEVTGEAYELNGAKQAKFASELLDKMHVTPEYMLKIYGEGGEYFSHFWAGQRGDLPSEKMIRASIGLALRGWPKRDGKPIEQKSRFPVSKLRETDV